MIDLSYRSSSVHSSMRYNTKFAFLAVAVLCATTFALPLSRNAGSIVAREVNDGDPPHHHHHDHHHDQVHEHTDPGSTTDTVDSREDDGDGDGMRTAPPVPKPGRFYKLVHAVGDGARAIDGGIHRHLWCQACLPLGLKDLPASFHT